MQDRLELSVTDPEENKAAFLGQAVRQGLKSDMTLMTRRTSA